jgi:anti-sigma B factor antagonist
MALEISKEAGDNAFVIAVQGEVDLYSSPDLRKAIQEGQDHASGTLAVDLAEVAYMDSSGVATLVEGLRAMNKKKSDFVVLRPSPPVLKVLQLSRLDTVFDIRDEV